MIAKELISKHGLKQLDVANLLGVSQSAISLYGRKIRGRALDLEIEKDIVSVTKDLASKLAEGEMDYTTFLFELCKICGLVRSTGLMCNLHKAFNSKIDINRCKICAE
jgi:predicted transcriptional regulator